MAGGGKGSVGAAEGAGNHGHRTWEPEAQEGASRTEGVEEEEEEEAAALGEGSGKGANSGTACGIPGEMRRARLLRKRYTRCRDKWTRMSVCTNENIIALSISTTYWTVS